MRVFARFFNPLRGTTLLSIKPATGLLRAALSAKRRGMLVIDDLSVRIAGRTAARRRFGAHSDRRAGRPGRPQRHRQDHAVPRHHRRYRGRARPRRDPAALAHRTARAGSAGRAGQPARGRAQGRIASAPRCWPKRRPRHDPHRIAEIQTRLADIGAHAAPARAASILAGLGFSDRRPAAALLGIFRRLAHARRARRDAVRRARPAAARRADQLSRSRRHALAAGPPGALSAHA